MKRRAIASLVFGAFLVVGAAQQRNSTPEALLGRAIHQEDAEGDLEAAIATYKEFLPSTVTTARWQRRRSSGSALPTKGSAGSKPAKLMSAFSPTTPIKPGS